MADERDTEFATELKKMSDAELRQQIDPSVQAVPILRSMAVTEIEKRRQKRTNALLKRRVNVTQLTAWMVWGTVIVVLAAALIWLT